MLRHDRSVSWISTKPKRWIPLARGAAQHYSVRYDNDRARVGYFRGDAGLIRGAPVQVSPHEIEPGIAVRKHRIFGSSALDFGSIMQFLLPTCQYFGRIENIWEVFISQPLTNG